MRAVDSMWQRNFLFNLGQVKERYDKAINEVTSGKKLGHLSDSPSDMAYVLTLRSRIEQINQFDRNINSGMKYLNSGETALGGVQKLITNVITLAEQGASESNTGAARDLIANQVDQVRDQIINLANTQVMGKFIFAGTNTDVQPFVKDPATGIVTYVGNGESINMQVDPSVQMATNIPGDQAFMAPNDIFQRLQTLVTDLRNDNTAGIGNAISSMHEIVDQISESIGLIGNRISAAQDIQGQLKEFKNSISNHMGALENADMAESISNLTREQTALQSTLQAGASINKMSLMDFLS